MILKIQINWKSFWYSSFLWKFNIKVKNPPSFLAIPPFSPTSSLSRKIFHPHPYCQIWGSQSPPPPPPFVKGGGGVGTMVRKRTLKHLPNLTNHLANHLARSVRLQTKWLWVPALFQSLNYQIFHLIWARSFLTFR